MATTGSTRDALLAGSFRSVRGQDRQPTIFPRLDAL
jgi:hypothetical protein